MLHVVGGPFCGKRFRTTGSPKFIWTDGSRLYRRPGKDRHLYRLVRSGKTSTSYLYSSQTHGVCSGCNTVHRRTDDKTCTLCGGVLAAP